MLDKIIGWFATSGVKAIGEQLNTAYATRLKATTDHEKLEADQRIATLQAQQAVLIAEQGSWRTSWVRPAIAFPVVFFLNKVLVYDICLGLGVTPDPSPQVWWVITAVVSCYLLARGIEKR
jgi:hypothetical protein